MHFKHAFLLPFILLVACTTTRAYDGTPDPIQAYVNAGSSQATAAAAISTADYYAHQLTATMEAHNLQATERAWSVQSTEQSANSTATARVWEATTTAASIQSTSTAGDVLANLQNAWRFATPEERQELCSIILEKIVYDFETRKIVTIQPKSEYEVLFKMAIDL